MPLTSLSGPETIPKISPDSDSAEKCRPDAASSNSSKTFSIDSILKKPEISSPSKTDEKNSNSSDESDVVSENLKNSNFLENSPRIPVGNRESPSHLGQVPVVPIGPHVPISPFPGSLPNPAYANPGILWESIALRQRLLQSQIMSRNLLSQSADSLRILGEMYSNSIPNPLRQTDS